MFFLIAFSIILLVVQKNHNLSKSTMELVLSRILHTTFSFVPTGSVDTLTSISLESITSEYFQSCGIFVIFNFNADEYLSLSKTGLYSFKVNLKISTKTQSILNLTTT
ncbi:MAG: hypothetical protein Q8S84_04370 [bacterium]|nr:hypothetical protein [bacterium]MDP3380740.1 hypothetical protein [bacterium]